MLKWVAKYTWVARPGVMYVWETLLAAVEKIGSKTLDSLFGWNCSLIAASGLSQIATTKSRVY